jgi:hypothetical protein
MKIGRNFGIVIIASAFVASSVAAPPSLPITTGDIVQWWSACFHPQASLRRRP